MSTDVAYLSSLLPLISNADPSSEEERDILSAQICSVLRKWIDLAWSSEEAKKGKIKILKWLSSVTSTQACDERVLKHVLWDLLPPLLGALARTSTESAGDPEEAVLVTQIVEVAASRCSSKEVFTALLEAFELHPAVPARLRLLPVLSKTLDRITSQRHKFLESALYQVMKLFHAAGSQHEHAGTCRCTCNEQSRDDAAVPTQEIAFQLLAFAEPLLARVQSQPFHSAPHSAALEAIERERQMLFRFVLGIMSHTATISTLSSPCLEKLLQTRIPAAHVLEWTLRQRARERRRSKTSASEHEAGDGDTQGHSGAGTASGEPLPEEAWPDAAVATFVLGLALGSFGPLCVPSPWSPQYQFALFVRYAAVLFPSQLGREGSRLLQIAVQRVDPDSVPESDVCAAEQYLLTAQALMDYIVACEDPSIRSQSYQTLRACLSAFTPALRFALVSSLLRNCPYASLHGLLINYLKDQVARDWPAPAPPSAGAGPAPVALPKDMGTQAQAPSCRGDGATSLQGLSLGVPIPLEASRHPHPPSRSSLPPPPPVQAAPMSVAPSPPAAARQSASSARSNSGSNHSSCSASPTRSPSPFASKALLRVCEALWDVTMVDLTQGLDVVMNALNLYRFLLLKELPLLHTHGVRAADTHTTFPNPTQQDCSGPARPRPGSESEWEGLTGVLGRAVTSRIRANYLRPLALQVDARVESLVTKLRELPPEDEKKLHPQHHVSPLSSSCLPAGVASPVASLRPGVHPMRAPMGMVGLQGGEGLRRGDLEAELTLVYMVQEVVGRVEELLRSVGR